MDENPNEGTLSLHMCAFPPIFISFLVVTLLFTNPEGADVQTVWDPIFKSAGMDQLAFVPPNSPDPIKQSEWPTLGEMIDSGKKLVVFMDADA